MVFPFVASFTSTSVGLEASFDLRRMTMQYIGFMVMVLAGHREMRRVERKFSRLRAETEEFKCILKSVSAPYCPSGLFTSNVHLLDHQVENLERCGRIYFAGAALFEHLTC